MSGKTFPVTFLLGLNDQATAKFKRATTEMARFGAKSSSVGKSMTLGVTAPIAGLGGAAVKSAMDFHDAMANVSTIIDTNVESIDDMSKSVLDMSRKTPVALSDLTSAMYQVRSAGVPAAEQFRVLEQSAKLSVAGIGSVEDAVLLASGAVNAFGLKGGETQLVFDTMFGAISGGTVKLNELVQGFGAVAGTVAASGTKVDDYIASIAALTTTTRPASTAHTQMKAVIGGLTRVTAESSAMFRQLSADDLPDLIKKSGGLVPALVRIRENFQKIKGPGKSVQSDMLKLLGSQEALDAAMSITGEQHESYASTLDKIRNSSGLLAEAYDKKMQQPAAKLKVDANKVQASMIDVGTRMMPIVERIATQVEEAVKWFDGLSDSTKSWALTAAGVAALVGPAAIVIGQLTGAVMGLHRAYVGIKGAAVAYQSASALIAAGNGTMSASLAVLATQLGAVAAAAGALWLAWDRLQKLDTEMGGELWSSVKKSVTEGKGLFTAYDEIANEKAVGASKAAAYRKSHVPTVSAQELAKSAAINAYAPAPAAPQKVEVSVDFKNTPPGTKAVINAPKGSYADMSVGYANSLAGAQ